MADRKGQQSGPGGRGDQAGRGGQSGAQGGAQGGGGRAAAGRAAAAAPSRRERQEELPPPPTGPRPTPRLRERYDREVRDTLMQDLGYSNIMQVPKIEKVVINIGMGEALTNPQAMDNAMRDLELIVGQRPVVTKAKRSIAAFKLREGNPIGCMVTLRGARMYDFLDKLFNVALARVRDFTGVSPESFDGRGNYNLGVREQLIFPEIEYDRIDRVRGMDVAIVTTARTDDEGRRLLQLMGMPFRTEAEQARRAAEASRGSRAS
jgi:large subunit ribosomal protein L5